MEGEPKGSVEEEVEAQLLKCGWFKGETEGHLGARAPRMDQESSSNRIYCRNTPPAFRSFGPRPLEAALKQLPAKTERHSCRVAGGADSARRRSRNASRHLTSVWQASHSGL